MSLTTEEIGKLWQASRLGKLAHSSVLPIPLLPLWRGDRQKGKEGDREEAKKGGWETRMWGREIWKGRNKRFKNQSYLLTNSVLPHLLDPFQFTAPGVTKTKSALLPLVKRGLWQKNVPLFYRIVSLTFRSQCLKFLHLNFSYDLDLGRAGLRRPQKLTVTGENAAREEGGSEGKLHLFLNTP